MSEKLTLVKFEMAMSPYQPGETAGFEPERAKAIVEKLHAARYLTSSEQAEIDKIEAQRQAQRR